MQCLWLIFAAVGAYAMLSTLGGERERLVQQRIADQAVPPEVPSEAVSPADPMAADLPIEPEHA